MNTQTQPQTPWETPIEARTAPTDLTWSNSHGTPLPQIGDRIEASPYGPDFVTCTVTGYRTMNYSNHPREWQDNHFLCPVVTVEGTGASLSLTPNEVRSILPKQ